MLDVAVIGAGGVAGLAALYELLHTDSEGKCLIKENTLPEQCFFNVVGFEQKTEIGGTWFTDGFRRDPLMPPQNVMDSEQYDNVRVIKAPHSLAPTDERLQNSSLEAPILTEKDPEYCNWSATAIWPRLYTNVPESYMRYSTTSKNDQCPTDLAPFVTHEQLRERLLKFGKRVQDKIRFNTEVYNVEKRSGKWFITLRVPGEDNVDIWYQQSFDRVILAQGSFSIPFIPHFKGLSKYVKQHPGSVIHAKGYRDPSEFAGKRVVIVGANISAIDLGQYLQPVCKEVIISRKSTREPYLPYMSRCINSFKNVELIKEFTAETKELLLNDGTVLQDVDQVILATGYHIEIPFLQEGVFQYSIPEGCAHPTSNSRVKGLYQHVFNVEDTTIAFVGKIVVQTLFRNMESHAAAVVGVWTGRKQLPTKEEQYAWEEQRLNKVEEHLFHKYDIHTLKEDFFDPMSQFYLDDRPDPLSDRLLDTMDPYNFSLETFEMLFNEFRTGKRELDHNFNTGI